MVSYSTLSKDKGFVDVHVPGESGLDKQHMPGEKGLCSTTVSALASSQVSLYATANADIFGEKYHGGQHTEEENGLCLPPVSPFISDQHSQYASVDADIPHRSDHCKQHTTEGNDFHVTTSSPFTSERDPVKQHTAEGNGLCLNQLSPPVTPAKDMPNALVGSDFSHESDHDTQHAPEDSGFLVTPISAFSSCHGSLSALVNVEISHEADHGKTQTPNGTVLCSTPVSPFTRGQGLPYAPENMPCPGDTWSWRVGRRVNSKGFFIDRYLCPPERLRTPEIRKEGFGSKVSVEKYVLTEFRQANLDEFFSSFSWLVPAESMFWNQAQLVKHHTENSKEKNQGGVSSDVPIHSISRKRKRKPVSVDYASLLTKFSRSKSEKGKGKYQKKQPRLETILRISKKRKHERRIWCDAMKFYSRRPKIQPLVMLETEETGLGEQRSTVSPTENQSNRQSCGSRSDENPPCNETRDIVILAGFSEDSGSINQDMRTTANIESNQVSCHNICNDLILFPTLSCQDSIPCKASVKAHNHESSAETVDVDQYINSLEDFLAQSVVLGTSSVDTDEVLNLEKKMAEARSKLSSFFAMDFSVFVSSGMHSEFANLLGVLIKDPNLTTDQLVQLKLQDVIPLLRTRYLEEAKAIEEANSFFEDLRNKVAKAYSCKDEYNDFKAKEAHIQAEIDSKSLRLQKIEEEISLLISQRDEVADTISSLMTQRNGLNLRKKDIVEIFLPDIVSRIQMANSKRMKWQSKKLKALERQAEISDVFVSIKEKTT